MMAPASNAAIECQTPFVAIQTINKPPTQNQESPECAKKAAALREILFFDGISSRVDNFWSISNMALIMVYKCFS